MYAMEAGSLSYDFLNLVFGETERTTRAKGISKLVAALMTVDEKSSGIRSIARNNNDHELSC